MTIAPDAAPLALITIDDAIAVLRERGFRLSASQRLVREALFAANEKPVCPIQPSDQARDDGSLSLAWRLGGCVSRRERGGRSGRSTAHLHRQRKEGAARSHRRSHSMLDNRA